MKIVIALITTLSAVTAGAATLECNQVKPTGGHMQEFASVQLTATLNHPRGEVLENVVVKALSEYDSVNGDAGNVQESMPGTLRYIPVKRKGGRYEKLNHFDLTDLQRKDGVRGYNGYAPGQDCYIQLWLPKNLMSLKSFSAPSNSHCEQNGGFNLYQCTVQGN